MTDRSPAPPAQRFWRHVQRDSATGCWLWVGTLNDKGYPQFRTSATTRGYAHRYSYELFVKPIPAGLTIDHLCRTPRCVNPAHLEPVTMAENLRRARRPLGDYCRHGHSRVQFTRLQPNGRIYCTVCHRISAGKVRGYDWSEPSSRRDGRSEAHARNEDCRFMHCIECWRVGRRPHPVLGVEGDEPPEQVAS